jgi:hypothetical protein
MIPKSSTNQPIILRWHPGALWDADLNLYNGRELLKWASYGLNFVVLDHETGEDITRLFLAHWNESLTSVVDPIGSKHA